MTKVEFVLNVFSLFPDTPISDIQAQKLFFLIEKRLNGKCGDEVKKFNFEPNNYGPFAKALAENLKECTANGALTCHKDNKITYYQINRFKILDTSNFLGHDSREFIKNELVQFISQACFKDLCFSIYKEFPEMAKNSIFLRK